MFGLVNFVLGMLKDFAAGVWAAASGEAAPEASANADLGAGSDSAPAATGDAASPAFASAANDNLAHLYGSEAVQTFLHVNSADDGATAPSYEIQGIGDGALASSLFHDETPFDGHAASLADAFSALQRANALFGDSNDDVLIVASYDTSDGAGFAFGSTYDVPFS